MSPVTIENIQTRHNTFRHLREDAEVCRIRRGYYARFHSPDNVHLWDLWQAVALSRIFASAALARSGRIFTGRSALLLHAILHGFPIPMSSIGGNTGVEELSPSLV